MKNTRAIINSFEKGNTLQEFIFYRMNSSLKFSFDACCMSVEFSSSFNDEQKLMTIRMHPVVVFLLGQKVLLVNSQRKIELESPKAISFKKIDERSQVAALFADLLLT